MNTNSLKLKLEAFCEFINGGAWNEHEYTDTGIPVLKVSNIKNQVFSLEDIDYLSIEGAKKYAKNLLKEHDLIVATVGSHPNLINSAAGRTISVPKSLQGYLLNQNAVCIRTKDNDVLFQPYLRYIGETDFFRVYIQARGKGAANQMRIAIGEIKNFPVNLPELAIQKKIAAILSTYDDLIENNLKRIKLLEEMAQITYEEWFVRLKFPGHETTPLDSVTGLPVGWEKLSLNNLVDFVFGYPFNSSQFNTERIGMPIIRIRNIPDSSTSDFTTEIVDSKYIVNPGDLLVGMDGEFYINNWSSSPAYLVQRTCNLKPLNNRDIGFIREAIRAPIKFYESTISGATVAHLGKKHLDEIELIFPTQDADKLLTFFVTTHAL